MSNSLHFDERTSVTPAGKPSWSDRFERDGFGGPVPFLHAEDCRALLKHIEHVTHPAPLDWLKGRAATDRELYALAVRPALLSKLKPLLGPNIILWGAQVVRRKPGQVHPWHTDIESSSPGGGFVSVWVGLKGTSRGSSLQLISRSHLFGESIQEASGKLGVGRDQLHPEMLLNWARERDDQASLVELEMTDGDALFFDGRLWHGSHNRNPDRERLALLLQYASADQPVRIPEGYDWPFRQQVAPWPPVILVRGSAGLDLNRIVPPPLPIEEKRPLISTAIKQLKLPLAENPEKGWKPYHLFQGPTRILEQMGCHVSVLSPGRSPHPPHAHKEEEILMVLAGEAEVVIAKASDDPAPRVERMHPGQFVYYPAFQHHTLRNQSGAPITYLMFKWYATPSQTAAPLGTTIYDCSGTDGFDPAKLFSTRRVFSQATACLYKLHAHVTCLQPGGGYVAHVDAHDVAIIVLSGKVETLGAIVEANGIIYYSAGEPHDMRNAGAEPVYYLVLEFHAPGTAVHRVRKTGAKNRKPVGKWQGVLKIPGRIMRSVWKRLATMGVSL